MPTSTELILCIRFQNESFLAGIRTRGPVGVWRREPCIDEKAGSGLLPRLPRAPPPQSHARTAQLSETESSPGQRTDSFEKMNWERFKAGGEGDNRG